MNDKINELALKANEWMPLLDGNVALSFNVERFAELIIRECAIAIDNVPIHELDFAIIHLSKHFGEDLKGMMNE